MYATDSLKILIYSWRIKIVEMAFERDTCSLKKREVRKFKIGKSGVEKFLFKLERA